MRCCRVITGERSIIYGINGHSHRCSIPSSSAITNGISKGIYATKVLIGSVNRIAAGWINKNSTIGSIGHCRDMYEITIIVTVILQNCYDDRSIFICHNRIVNCGRCCVARWWRNRCINGHRDRCRINTTIAVTNGVSKRISSDKSRIRYIDRIAAK